MNISQNGLDLIKKWEGCCLTAYKDSIGVWTIGWGTTNSDKSITGTTIQSGLKISQATADEWLEKSVNQKYCPLVDKYNSGYNFNQNQFDALVSFCYNVGSIDQLTANGTRSIEEIATHITAYCKAGGKTLQGLVNRRNDELALFNTPVSTSNTENTIDTSKVKYFDYDLYNDLYSDLAKAYSRDETKLKEHYAMFGIKEGRTAGYIFDPKYYLSAYKDLQNAFGTDYEKAYNHFISFGISEGRKASKIFDVKYYVENNADLKKAYNTNYKEAIEHFVIFGINEFRKTSAEFNVNTYKSKYKDLQDNFKNNCKNYYKHYLIFGQNEGRKCI